MARPRIEGLEERIIESFIERGLFSSPKDVISAALKSLVREQRTKEFAEQSGAEAKYSDATYESQFESLDAETDKEENNAPVGNLARKTATR